MNIRKLLYLPTAEQKNVLVADIEQIMTKCDKIASVEWKEQKENQKSHDGICPKCRARQEDIVDKIVDTFPDLNKTVMLKVYNKNDSPYNHEYIKVVDFIHYPDMMGAYPSLSLHPEIKIDAETKRYYPYGTYASHIVGYTGFIPAEEAE